MTDERFLAAWWTVVVLFCTACTVALVYGGAI